MTKSKKNMTREVYAFAGKRFSGKSTASKVLVDMGFVDAKFAEPLKNMMRAFYETCGVDKETAERKIEGDLKEVECPFLSGKTPRYAMQTLGTEWRNMISTTLWSDIFVQRVESGVLGDKIVCSDYRFPHEAEALKRLGAQTYRIERAGLVDDAVSAHISESGVDKLPVGGVIPNNGTVEDLKRTVMVLVVATRYADDLVDREPVPGTEYFEPDAA
jgi:hypothetical protein